MNWETFCRRTNDPKLSVIERMLTERGIAHRRNGESFHAPILEVDSQQADKAWAMLSETIDGRELDEIPDNDPIFY
jgi:hypothetical protein